MEGDQVHPCKMSAAWPDLFMKVVARRGESQQWLGGRGIERLSVLVNTRCLSKQAQQRLCGLAASRARTTKKQPWRPRAWRSRILHRDSDPTRRHRHSAGAAACF